MKNFIIWLLIAFVFVGSIVYFVFTSDKSFTITYIKFNINPEFIIGVNNNDEVKIYNPLNDDAKVLNLTMFNGRKIEDAMMIILDKLDSSNYLDDSLINISVITKNNKKIEHFYNKIDSVIKTKNKEITLVNKEASYDELVAYSNEVTYDLEPTYKVDILKNIASNINSDIVSYIDNKLKELNLEDMAFEDKKNLILLKTNESYFNDYLIHEFSLEDNKLIIDDESTYEIVFNYDNEEITFKIKLNLSLEYVGSIIKNDVSYNVIEEYIFIYENDEIRNLKNNFYKFS